MKIIILLFTILFIGSINAQEKDKFNGIYDRVYINKNLISYFLTRSETLNGNIKYTKLLKADYGKPYSINITSNKNKTVITIKRLSKSTDVIYNFSKIYLYKHEDNSTQYMFTKKSGCEADILISSNGTAENLLVTCEKSDGKGMMLNFIL